MPSTPNIAHNHARICHVIGSEDCSFGLILSGGGGGQRGWGCPIRTEIAHQLLLISPFQDGPSWLANKCSGFGYSFSDCFCWMLPDRRHKFHSASIAGPGGGPSLDSPAPPVLMTPEPCHCCEKPDQMPSIPVAGNSSAGLSDSRPKARNSGRVQKRGEKQQRPHFKPQQASALQRLHRNGQDVGCTRHKPACSLACATKRPQLPYLPDGSSALSPGRMGKGRIHFHSCLTITAQHHC